MPQPQIGDNVIAPHPQGGIISGRIESIDNSSDYAEAYGPQAKLDTGYSACLSQCQTVDEYGERLLSDAEWTPDDDRRLRENHERNSGNWER